MRFRKDRAKSTPSVIIVSLIDVLIVVLIFLMVSTHFKSREASLKLALPESKEAKSGAGAEAKPFVISVATNAPYFYMGEVPVTLDRLQIELFNAAKTDPRVNVAIKADRHAPFGEVIKVIDAARAAKVGSINAITEKAGSKP